MKRATLTAEHATLAAIHRRLAEELGFPGHYGANLDALYDVLTGDAAGPIEIVWEGWRAARLALGGDYDRLAATLKDVARERSDFRLILR